MDLPSVVENSFFSFGVGKFHLNPTKDIKDGPVDDQVRRLGNVTTPVDPGPFVPETVGETSVPPGGRGGPRVPPGP